MSYWILALLVLLFGLLTGFSIGVFVLPIGAALLLLGPLRRRAKVYWPLLLAVVGFVVGYLLLTPLTCVATMPATPGAETDTVCTSILGPEYRTTGAAVPPNNGALLVGVAAAAGTGAVTLGVLLATERRRERSAGAAPR